MVAAVRYTLSTNTSRRRTNAEQESFETEAFIYLSFQGNYVIYPPYVISV
jgi:hypothetical protein